ncbi:MAG: MFS transporter, partial [Rhodoluna sp.]
LAMGLLSPVVGGMYDKFGARKLLIPASIAVGAVLWFMTTWDSNTQMLEILITYLVFMVGLGFFFTPLFALSMGSVEPQLYSHASATVGALQQVGGAAGTAIFVTVFTLASVAAGGSGSAVDGVAVSAGVHQAFILGAVLWLATPVLALMVRAPKVSQKESND